MPVALSEVRRLERANQRVFTEIGSTYSSIFRDLPENPRRARDILLDIAPQVTLAYGDTTAVAAAEWYEQQRRRELGGSYNARLAGLPSAEAVREDVRWSAGALFTDGLAVAEDRLSTAAVRKVLTASRETIGKNATQHDNAAAGWQRIADPDGCEFCVMLSQNGAVYKRDTVDFAAHNNCNCSARPAWDDSLPEVDVRAYEASERHEDLRRRAAEGDESAERQLEANRNRTRAWIENNRGQLDDYRAALAELD